MTTTLPMLYSAHDGIATISFNRPEARNALTPEMLCRLADAIVAFAADDSLRVAIITGIGDKAFCAGGDLALTLPLMTGARAPVDAWDRRLLEDPLVAAASQLRGFPLHKPLIAAINGACLAAGTELMLGTDIRVAAEHATFGLPEVTRGLLPFAGSMARLPRQVAWCHAMELMLVGDAIPAQEAHRIGLVNHVVPAADVMAKAQQLARRIASNGPVAVQQVKRTALASSGVDLAAAYLLEDEARRVVLASEDAREGPRAFAEKRAPRFQGR
jgi:enoyl-CoA hydratase